MRRWRALSARPLRASGAHGDAANETIHCESAPQPVGTVALEVSLNAQQYTSSAVGFTFYAPAAVALVSPDAGPTSGGTLVRLWGDGFAVGREHRCRFGSHVVPGTVSVLESNATLLCVSPALANGSISLEVAINSQNYTSSGVVL